MAPRLLVLLSGLIATAATQLTPLPPSQDPFYATPPDYQHAAPGEILRIRNAPGNLTASFANASSVYNILFRTTDTHYEPSYAWTTLFVPKKNANTNTSALLSYQIPYNTPDVDAGPSTLLYASGGDLALVDTDIQASLSRGWYVNVPDFEGPKASFVCGVQAGHATLDSIRAVLGHSFTNRSQPKVALWGYSGGSFASGFALELQVQYAPELGDILAGAALGGILPNITNALPNVARNSTFAALIPAGLVGLATQHPQVEAYLASQLRPSGPYNASTFLSVRNMSISEAFVAFAYQDMYNYFLPLPRNGSILSAPAIAQPLARDASLGYHGIPTAPMYIYKAVHDEISPVEDADALVERYCQGGAEVVYERNGLGGHLAEESNGDARALEVLQRMLEGRWVGGREGCVVRDVAVNVTDSAL
ncbi:secretory lipase-domain-containing [Lecanosticta acicola]|uniref:Secretory lipase-domain-containing n=1 Tax=Lecanosticta acicola TaxID=111012 RepID=A0AAI8Z1K1_9PEZI|nr:secretory lipase-domain-containing [Lecanosticta acicola]